MLSRIVIILYIDYLSYGLNKKYKNNDMNDIEDVLYIVIF